MIAQPPQQPLTILAELRSPRMHCSIVQRASDSQNGSPIIARCGEIAQPLGREQKGVAIDRISACQIVLQIHAVHFPRLLEVDNCSGRLAVTETGRSWTEGMRRSLRLGEVRVQYVAYERTRPGCYRLTMIYTARAGAGDSPFRDAQRMFCVARKPIW